MIDPWLAKARKRKYIVEDKSFLLDHDLPAFKMKPKIKIGDFKRRDGYHKNEECAEHNNPAHSLKHRARQHVQHRIFYSRA